MVCLTKFSRKSLLNGGVEKVSVYRFYDTNTFHVCQYKSAFSNGFFNIMSDDDRYERLEQALHRSLTRPDCEADFDLEVDDILNEKERFILELCR